MISRIFVERPRLAGVVSIVLLLAGILSIFALPVAQYPQVTPPTVTVRAAYPGADAAVLADTVAGPIEDAVNGVDDMIYMSSTSDSSGSYQLTVTFEVGTDPDMAQVKVQNRVSQAMPLLPAEVTQQGVTVDARSADMLGFVMLRSPGGTLDELFLSDYAYRIVKPALDRIPGVSEAQVFGPRYSMRVWLDADRMASMELSSAEVIAAIREQNIQASIGVTGAAPAGGQGEMAYTLTSTGRLNDPDSFRRIVVRTADEGAAIVYLGDIARVERGADNYLYRARLNGEAAVAMGISRASGSNALQAMDALRAELDRLSAQFPDDMEYVLPYDATNFVRVSIREIVQTIFFTGLLVILVCYIFLQDWRATLIPALTIPVSLCATFAVLMVAGFSINTLTLFGLVLAIGLVVDDAIVVVERVIYLMETERLDARTATLKAMGQVTGAVVATTLVLLAIFVPIGFAGGITGRIYQQFAVAISAAVSFSTVNALTLSPALCSILLRESKPKQHGPLRWFNTGLSCLKNRYVSGSMRLARRMILTALLVPIILGAAAFLGTMSPTAFLPEEDQGVLMGAVQLPEGASRDRTDALLREVISPLYEEPGIVYAVDITGFSFIGGSGENMAFFILGLDSWDQRRDPEMQIAAIQQRIQGRLAQVPGARINLFVPPAIMGLGVTGGLDIRLQAIDDPDPHRLNAALNGFLMNLRQTPGIMFAFSGYAADTPHVYLEIDRDKAALMQVRVGDLFAAMQSHFGSRYISDVNFEGQVNRVIVQADLPFRDQIDQIARLHVKSRTGEMVPLAALVTPRPTLAPRAIDRYNKFPSASVIAMPLPFISSGQAMQLVDQLAVEHLPAGYTFEWSGLSYQEARAAGRSVVLVAMAVLFGYLFLVAQYESWMIPLPVMLSTSVAGLGSLIGMFLLRMPLSIYAQLGLILLVGLASKNAILIVEFSRARREEGMTIMEAAADGAGQRFRAVLMTAFTFIFGILPMVVAVGAGAAARQSIGRAVFFGMLAATLFGIVFVPALYVLFQTMREKAHAQRKRFAAGGAVSALLIGALLLNGCVKVGPNYQMPDWPETGFSETDVAADPDAAPWWTILEDDELSDLVSQALENNREGRAAEAAVRAARARLGIARAALGPRIDAQGGVTTRRSGDEVSQAGRHDLYRAGFDAAWEIDLFGGRRRSAESAAALFEAAEAARDGVEISLAAETAQALVLLRTSQQRLRTARERLAFQEETVELVDSRVRSGLSDDLELYQARSERSAVRAGIPLLETAVENSLNALAILTGQMPGSLHERLDVHRPIPVAAVRTVTGIPADALRQRPDVRRAERELAAQTARIGAARADLYPRFTLTGSIGIESLSASTLGDAGSEFYSAGPGVRWAIFHSGSIRANIRAQEAGQEEALARYEQTVLAAVGETRDALSAFDSSRQRVDSLRDAVESAERSVELTESRYASGLVDYQRVLDAQRTLRAVEDQFIESRGRIALDFIRLCKALGGGWTPMAESVD